METNLQIIRAACIAANPSILELKFGCGVIDEIGFPMTIWRVFPPLKGKQGVRTDTYKTDDISKFKIIGRPIRLADVLLAIECSDNSESTKEDKIKDLVLGGIFYENRHDLRVFKGFWNLVQDDLTLQSSETLEFLANLLK